MYCLSRIPALLCGRSHEGCASTFPWTALAVDNNAVGVVVLRSQVHEDLRGKEVRDMRRKCHRMWRDDGALFVQNCQN